ncbi:hypothetical protein A2130_00215 [Candidatus Woesebacteria bacterium GWC2_33_12]|nr:MAG: hypothetical protein A2130_00215 [Candidatus Woesebacteria bacterium GWC2_33_12]OGM80618.1 MAG: hypothetical protein A2366_04195 [Candidatus Woesebacteria bacterium RIFOXYB1_FULL_33_9]OGM87506.1 MAG: hypothetical protein A2616_03280 [Candidatus Woesebacteria bacterium RIFOXYD1_FULL_33_11]HCR35935.1 hypothetical protein [Candidatus Woesebacteria bacterium]
MTKQDKKIRVSFGGGFKIKNDNQRNLYPKERLSEFLNVDPNNEIDVRNYCSKYTLIPQDLTGGLLAGFAIEQRLIKQILENFKSGKLTEENIKKINSEIKIYPSFKVFSKRDLSEFNKSLGRDDSILANHSNDKILLKVSTHQSTFSSLLSDLVEHFISEQKIRECVDCGKFFVLENPKRLFCDDSCRDRYKKRKKYKVKKES